MAYTTLISADELNGLLGNTDLRIFDCRFRLNDKIFGRNAYLESHVPNANYADLEQDLSGEISASTGRHPLPDLDAFREKLGAWGVDANTQLVVYDDLNGAMATRLWWMLRWAGHRKVALLDGGWTYWTAQGFPVTLDLPQATPTASYTAPSLENTCTLAEVMQTLHQPQLRLLDARDGARFRGEVEPIDRVPGHIPGAQNRAFANNLQPDGRFKPASALREEIDQLLQGSAPSELVHYCGSGVTACHNLLAFEIAGLQGSRLYPGSYSEWLVDPARPVEK